MSNKSDKPLVTKVVIICTLAISLFLSLFCIFSYARYYQAGFIIPFIIMDLGYGAAIIMAYKNADSGTKDNSSRGWVIGFTILILLFISIWAAAGNEKVEPGSPQMEVLK